LIDFFGAKYVVNQSRLSLRKLGNNVLVSN
jgi:hypothetical protein